MAGTQAGTLYIEILADVARLEKDLQQAKRAVGAASGQIAKDARAANANLQNIGRGAGGGFQQFSREVARLKASIDPAWAALERYKQQVDLLRVAQIQGALTQDQYRQQIRLAKAEYQNAGAGIVKTSGAMTSGLQQAGFQISDFAVQVGGGTSAIRAASQQAPQFIQALALMGAGADGAKGRMGAFLGFLAGPWGIGITVAVSVLGALASAFLDSADASDKKMDAAKDLADALDDLHASTVRESQSTWASIQNDIDKANSLRTRSIEARKAAIAELELAKAAAERFEQARNLQTSDGAGGGAARGALGVLEGGYRSAARDLQAEIDRQNAQIGQANETIRLNRGRQTQMQVAAQFDASAAASLKYDRALDGLNRQLRAGNISQADYRSQLVAITAAREADIEAAKKSDSSGRSRTERITEEQRALKRRDEDAMRFIESLEQEIARIELSEGQLRQLEIARAREAAVTEEQRKKIDELNVAREEALSTASREKAIEKDREATMALAQYLAQIESELALLGLVGPQRELAALALEETAFKAKAAKDGIFDVEAAWRSYLETRTRVINDKSAFEREAEAAEILNNQLRDMIGLLGNIGGVGQGIGALLGIFSGNTGAVGGVLGDILNQTIGTRVDEKSGKVVAQTIGDELSKFFDKDSPLVKSLQAAGTGLLVGNAAGFNGTGGQLGSAIGGALGEQLGEKFLSKGLESIAQGLGGFAGPLGSIVGGLLGGALGSLLKSTPRGSATIGGVNGALGITGTRGNSQARIAAASDSANAVITGLEDLAAELGATIDPSRGSVSIGIRDGNFRVDPTGQGRTKTRRGAVDFGEDAQAAALFAMQDLIRDGVLVGLREGTEQLLKNASDLESGIQKALAFEGVFRELQGINDPLGAALDDLTKEFDRLRKIFEEAGATAEEYAQLEELLAIKRQEAIDDAQRRFIEEQRERIDLEVDILRLLGRESEALALARETELAGMKATFRPLQQMIFTLQDARAIIDQFGPLAEGLRAFKDELLGSRAPNSFGTLQSQFRSTAELARNGDAAALAKLQQVSSEYLDAAKDQAASALDYQRAVGEVLAAVDSGIFAADAQIEYAQLQIDAINAQSDMLQGLLETQNTMQAQLVAQGEWVERIYRRWDGDGLLIRNDADTPIRTQEVA